MPTLVREVDDGRCAVGRLLLPGGAWLYTLERPWLDNRTGVSCIPAPGIYHAQMRRSPRLGDTYWLHDVPDRTFILIHSATVVGHLQGCIALGLRRGWLSGERAIFNSRTAVRHFETLMGRAPFTLEVL